MLKQIIIIALLAFPNIIFSQLVIPATIDRDAKYVSTDCNEYYVTNTPAILNASPTLSLEFLYMGDSTNNGVRNEYPLYPVTNMLDTVCIDFPSTDFMDIHLCTRWVNRQTGETGRWIKSNYVESFRVKDSCDVVVLDTCEVKVLVYDSIHVDSTIYAFDTIQNTTYIDSTIFIFDTVGATIVLLDTQYQTLIFYYDSIVITRVDSIIYDTLHECVILDTLIYDTSYITTILERDSIVYNMYTDSCAAFMLEYDCDLSISPNPSNGSFFVEVTHTGIIESGYVEVFNNLRTFDKKFLNGQAVNEIVGFNGFTRGTYFVRAYIVVNGKTFDITKKLIVL